MQQCVGGLVGCVEPCGVPAMGAACGMAFGQNICAAVYVAAGNNMWAPFVMCAVFALGGLAFMLLAYFLVDKRLPAEVHLTAEQKRLLLQGGESIQPVDAYIDEVCG